MGKKEILSKAYSDRNINKAWTEESKEAVLEAMEEYARQKCKEQRESCFDVTVHSKFGWYKAKKETILNAPEPKYN